MDQLLKMLIVFGARTQEVCAYQHGLSGILKHNIWAVPKHTAKLEPKY